MIYVCNDLPKVIKMKLPILHQVFVILKWMDCLTDEVEHHVDQFVSCCFILVIELETELEPFAQDQSIIPSLPARISCSINQKMIEDLVVVVELNVNWINFIEIFIRPLLSGKLWILKQYTYEQHLFKTDSVLIYLKSNVQLILLFLVFLDILATRHSLELLNQLLSILTNQRLWLLISNQIINLRLIVALRWFTLIVFSILLLN